MRAVLAGLNMTTKRSSSAELDRRYDAPLDAAEMAVVGVEIGMTMAAENIRDLQIGTHGPGSGGRHNFKRQTVERALRRSDRSRGNLGIARRRRETVVSQQHLHKAKSTPLSSKWVAKLWRSVYTLTFLVNPAAFLADRQAECRTVTSIGLSPRAGNNQSVGRVSRQYVLRISSN
jgi:hypothetical protein